MVAVLEKDQRAKDVHVHRHKQDMTSAQQQFSRSLNSEPMYICLIDCLHGSSCRLNL